MQEASLAFKFFSAEEDRQRYIDIIINGGISDKEIIWRAILQKHI